MNDLLFDPEPSVRAAARELYQSIAVLPLICPHGHVDARLFADPDYRFGDPAQMLIVPDHYVVRMLYSQGIPMEDLGIPRQDGGAIESDSRRIWQRFADHFALFRGTPTGLWLSEELRDLFGITEKLTGANAQEIYDRITEKLAGADYRPRPLYERFNVEVLCTTDAATDTLEHHAAIRASGWSGDIRPTFRPDSLLNPMAPSWRDEIKLLTDLTGTTIHDYAHFVQALEARRAFFKELGATATDHAVVTPALARSDGPALFAKALAGTMDAADAHRFEMHMLWEMARMSRDDGLVMQLHVGSQRNHNAAVHTRFGPNAGADIPIVTEFTRSLQPFLNEYGNDPRMTIILFTLDETTYGRELAPLAGHYPALRLGPPWWFYDSVAGIRRYFDQVMETTGIYNTAGFNDDTRAFPSIPTRHDIWRRSAANWLAGLLVRGLIDEEDAFDMAQELAYRLAKKTYRL